MSTIKISLLIIISFALGFAASESINRYNQQQIDIAINKHLSNVYTKEKDTSSLEHTPTPVSSEATSQSHFVEEIATTKVTSFSWESVNQLIASSQYDDAIRLLQTQLGNPKNSAKAWYLLGQVYKKQSQPRAALDAWFRSLALELNQQKIDQLLKDIKGYLIQLKDTPDLFNEDYSWLISQYDELLKFTANDGELHLIMASLYLKLNDAYQAQYHALMAANDPSVQKDAETVLAKLNGEKLQEELAIPLTVAGNQYILNATVEGYPVRFLLDTGASLSGLSNNYTAKYPSLLKDTKPIRLNTASGTKNSILFTVNNINIGSLEFNQHILTQLPMDNAGPFDGLLGVDILGRFDFVIDQNASMLRLKARKK